MQVRGIHSDDRLVKTIHARPFTTCRTSRLRHAYVRASAQDSLTLERREVLIAAITGWSVGILCPSPADAIAKPAAENACSNFTKSSNGIEWCDTKQGDGASPTKGQLIRCHYTGRLSSGKVFDSSYGRRPLTFKVGNREVIQGWDKAILGDDDIPPMKEGGKRRVNIPPELAYGARGAGGVIPPNATLTFDVELLGKK